MRGRSIVGGAGLVALVVSLLAFGCGGEEPKGPDPVTVEGTITLADSEEPASGVTVELKDRETTTSADGAYSFVNVIPEKAVLTAEKDGYISYSQELEIEDQGEGMFEHTFALERKNQAPAVDAVTVNPSAFEPGQEGTAEVLAADPDGDELSYAYDASGGFEVKKSEDNGAMATVTAPDTFEGAGRLKVTVTDGHGGAATESVDLETVGNDGPSIVDLSATPTELAPGETSVLKVRAQDPDGDNLETEWTAPDGWSLTGKNQVQAQVQAPDEYGAEATVEVKVTDPFDETATAEVTLKTKENEGPRVIGVEATPPQVEPGATATLKVQAEDPDGQEVGVQWSGPSDWTIDAPQEATTQISAPGTYGASATFEVDVKDSEGVTATGSVRVSTITNDGPRVDSLTVSPQTVEKGGTVAASVTARDPNGDPLNYTWSTSKGWSITGDSGGGRKVFVEAPDKPGEAGVIEVKIDDGAGQETVASRTVSTRANRAPTIQKLVANVQQVDKNGTTGVAAVVNDPDGDQLSYNWSASGDWQISGSGANVDVQAPDSYSTNGTISVTVEDGFGGTATSQIFLRTVKNEGPTIQSFVANPELVARDGTSDVEVIASDPNGDSLSYNWSVSSSKSWNVKGSGPKVTIEAPDWPKSSGVVKVVVDDGNGQTNTATTVLETAANKAPVFTKPGRDLGLNDPDNPSPISHSRTFEFEFDATDADGDKVTYSVKSPSQASVDKNSGKVTWKPDRSKRGAKPTLTVEADDGFDTVERSVELEVGPFDLDVSSPTNLSKNNGMEFGDLDGDGKPDAVYVNRSGSNSADIEVAYSKGDGFGKTKIFTWEGRARRCVSPAIGDVDGDGDNDIFLMCDQGRHGDDNDFSYYVWENDGSGNFSHGERGGWHGNDGHEVADVELGDLDEDGDLDVVAVGREMLMIGENNGSGSFSKTHGWHRNCFRFYQVEIANMDGDSRNEIVFSNEDYCGSDYAEFQVRDVDNNMTVGNQLYKEGNIAGRYDEHPRLLGVDDLDGDGRKDVVIVEHDRQDIFYYENNGGGNFSRELRENYGNKPPHYQDANAISFGDMDGDGNNDVILGRRSNRQIHVYFGDGSMGIDSRRTVSLPSSDYSGDVYGVHVFDWDGNSEQDVVFGTHRGKVGVAK